MLFRTYWLTRLSVANCLTALRHPRLLDDSTILQPLRLEERRLLDSNPVITALDVTPTVVDEGETVTLSGKFQDAPPGEADHHILINWGDGQTSELTGDFSGSTSGANREFTATHIYQNAPTSGSSQNQYTITVTITDASNGSDTAQTHVSVNNTIPTLADLTITSPVLENDLATVSGRVVDAGSRDTHTVSVNWGDGSAASIIQLAAGESTFTATHRYLDDNPTGTPQDIYPVTVSVVDNENSGSQQQLNVTVQNVAPQITTLATKPDAVEEGSPLVLDGTFNDVGSRDTHSATIDWGDGSSSNVSAGGGIFSGEHTYADSGVYTIAVTLTDDDGGSSTSQINVTIGNSIPTLTDLTITSPVLENGLATVTGRVVDAGIRDTHTVSVNWGDGSQASIIQLAAGETTFTATHRYLDDNPTGTPQDIYPVTVSVVDNENSGSQQQLDVTVQNVAPQITSLTTKPDAVEEGSPLVLDGTFNDVGSRDTHSATIDWGDGSSSNVSAGGGIFSGEHTYADSGVYTIAVTLTDDDGGSSTSQIDVTIGNSIPTLTDLTITSPVLENGLATVTGRVVDAGIRDTHIVSVNWGDGSAASIIQLAARETTFTATHRYLDDNPTGTPQDIYPVTVSVVDNENSGSQQQLNVTVQNVAPQITSLTTKPDAVEEGSPLVLDGTFSDIGSRDTHSATIDWGDGSSSNVSAGGGIFSGEHTYVDSGTYTIAVTLTDDDGGSSTSQINVTIGNAIPTLNDLTITSPIFENGLATVTGRVVDAGSRDTHIVRVNWGDGSEASIIQLAAGETTFTATHRYLDDNPTGTPQDIYPVTVSVVDNENSGSQQQLAITVQNVAPQITTLTTKPDAVEEGSLLVLDGTFSDVGSRDTHSVTINWGDGRTSNVLAGGGIFNGEHTYVDSGVYTIAVTLTDDDGGSSTSQINVTIGNSIPTLSDLTITSPIFENGLATVTGRVVDAGIRDTHTVSVNWGDGSAASIIQLAAGETMFTATHRYLDDNPSGTPQDVYPVTISVVDNENSGSQQQLDVTVQNVAPQITTLATKPDAVEEGSPLVLDGTFNDVGSRDTHSATIDWGDGTSSNVSAAGGIFSGEHTYVDSGTYTIAVTLTDDDGGSSTSQINVTIGNAIPTLNDLTITSPIFENGLATVTGRVVDAGIRDTHTVSVNWGDGIAASIIQLPAGETTFTATHRYLDDNPTGTPQDIYPVTVSVVDNENSGSQQQLNVTVQNVAPQITTLTTKPDAVEEGSPLALDGTFSDVGSRDTHTATIDWGDGTSSNVAAGGGIFSGEHTYADSGVYTIAVTLTDDDGGGSTSQINVTIGNSIPTLTDLTITSPVLENGLATVTGRVVDAGIRDTHTVSVNWGDGSQASIIQLAAGETTFTATHRYLDDNPTGTPQDIYPVTVSVVDNENSGSQQQLNVTVQNVAPEITTLTTKPESVEEGSPLVLDGTFSDIGSRDTHSATIDWGDGSSSNVSAGGGIFSGEHTYADSGVYTIAVTLTDDDGGSSTSQINVTIGNSIPTLNDLTITSPIFENGFATVSGRVVDAGSRDTHTVSVNWGDGSASSIIQLAAGESTFTATHRYLDDNPTGTPQDIYPVTVSVVDNENSGSQQQLAVTVQNVAPIIGSATLTAIPEVDAEFVLSGKFSDTGSLDDHTLTVDWGDGSAPSVIQYAGGEQNFFASHVFESEGAFMITATLRDDDGAAAVSRFLADVSLETQLIVTEFPQATVANAPSGGYVAGVVIKSTRENITTTVSPNPTTSIPFEGNTSDRPVKAMENRGSQEEVVVIELLSPEGKRIRHQDLPKTILVDLPEYIRKLPDGHYRFYFKTPEAQRLIMDVHVRGGQIIDPGDLLKTQQQNVSQTPTNDGELPAQASALRIDAAVQGEATSAHIDHPNWEATVDSAMSKFPESSSQVPWSARRSTSTF